MEFSGHEFPLDQRSGLNLTPDKALRIEDQLDLDFYLRFDADHGSYYGYVFRMIIGDRNIDLLHGVVRGNPNNFELILGDEMSSIKFPVAIERLWKEWIHLSFHLNFKSNIITCSVDGHVLSDTLAGYDPSKGLRLMFGGHSFGRFESTDVPSMIIRDVEIKSIKNRSIKWPLNQTKGTIVNSIPSGHNGVAINPDWLLMHHNTWKEVLKLELNDSVKIAYDARSEDWYLLSLDSVFIYNVRNDSLRNIKQQSPPLFNRSNHITYDTIRDKLLVYSLDNQYVGVFDAETGTWSQVDPGIEPLTSYWQHNALITHQGKLRILGGYGYHTYKNELLEWNEETEKFEKLSYHGQFNPRYLAGVGYNSSDSLYYVVGGLGSESGIQALRPDYYYEILTYSPGDNTFRTIHEFTDAQIGFCFSNSIVIDSNRGIYGLSFSKYVFKNKLQLVYIPLDHPEIVEVGNPIDYRFIDVNSFADLRYSESRDALYAISSFAADGKTSISIHSIAFPPQEFIAPAPIKDVRSVNYTWIIILGASVIIVIVTYLLFARKSKVKKSHRNVSDSRSAPKQISKQLSKENSILLFGGFQVFDNNGRDITGQFTPLPKKLFLYILLNSLRNEKGVSSNSLYETFWFDKSVESARNNRAVNIVKLKGLLEHLETTSISKDTGYWKFDFDPSFTYIDYYEYLNIVRSKTKHTREDMVALLAIVENSPFLNNTQAEWLDSFKSDVSNEIIDTFLKYISESTEDLEFLLHMTNCIFVFDPVSEEALKLQCRLLIKQGKHSLAKNAFTKFTVEYKQLYGENFDQSFNQVISE